MSEHLGFLLKQWDRVWSQRINRKFRRRLNHRKGEASCRRIVAQIEQLDSRAMLSSANVLNTLQAVPTYELAHNAGSFSPATSSPSGYSPAQIQAAYGFNRISLSSGGNGTGQTIAIVDAYHAPTILSDLQAFDRAFGLLDPPSLTVMSQTGSTTSLPGTDPSKGWELESALDVEWAHALAPGAKIVLVEASSSSYSDMLTAVRTAANLPGVSVVSMSWGGSEFSTEAAYDSYFTTPSGHQGVTFVASTGDNGAPGGFPAYSSNVLAVGGTTLNVNSSGNYVSESAWSGSGGGISAYESQPSYQRGFVTQSTTKRTIPDVSFDASPSSGVAVYCSFTNGTTSPWAVVGGTSFSAPAWGALVSIANQGRALSGSGSLDGVGQTLPMLYQLNRTNSSAFHDIVTGSNGLAAGSGYDLVTGLGSPVADLVTSGMNGSTSLTASKLVFQQTPTSGSVGVALSTLTVAVQSQSGQIVTSDNSTVTLSIASGPGGFASTSTISVRAVNGIATFTNLILGTAGTYTLTSADGSLSRATSNSISIGATLAAPQNVTLVALNPTSAKLSWNASPSAQGYNVYQVSGSQSTLLGTVSSSTTSVQINGLTPGSTVSFKVAAYNGSSTADSQVVTIKMPTVQLTAPVVALRTLTSTSIQLTWTASSGTEGYRVYWSDGINRYLLGTVPSNVTSVSISGLARGTRYQFQVEAYQGTTVKASAWVSITAAAKIGHSTTAPFVAKSSVFDWLDFDRHFYQD